MVQQSVSRGLFYNSGFQPVFNLCNFFFLIKFQEPSLYMLCITTLMYTVWQADKQLLIVDGNESNII